MYKVRVKINISKTKNNKGYIYNIHFNSGRDDKKGRGEAKGKDKHHRRNMSMRDECRQYLAA